METYEGGSIIIKWQCDKKKALNTKLCEKGGLVGKSLPSLIRGLVGNIPNNPCLVISFQYSGYWLMLKLETHLLRYKSDLDPVELVRSFFWDNYSSK